jgi:hypothetical protein
MTSARIILPMIMFCCLQGVFAQAPTVDFTERWVHPDESLVIRFTSPPDLASGEIRVLAGTTDVTALSHFASPAELVIDPSLLPFESGEHELVLYLVGSQGWKELQRYPLRVLTPGGFQAAEVTPRVNLNVKSRLDEGHNASAPPPPRTTYTDIAGEGGLDAHVTRGDFDMQAGFNGVGTSYRNEALRYGELGDDAPKVDLSEYQVAMDYRRANLSLGHISYGNNPLLLNSMSSRGMILGYQLTDRLDISGNLMNGTSITGYDNFFGLDNSNHRISGATVGYELLGDRPGGLRIETSYLDATVESQDNFNVGEVSDAEESHGFGIRLVGSSKGGRVRHDLVFARSTYTNPFDPLLAQGGTLQAVKETTNNGRTADIGFDLLRNSTFISETNPVSVVLNLHHERVEPEYKSLGSYFASDQEHNRATLDAMLGGAQLQVLRGRQEDNLDDIPTILKTRTYNTGVTLNLPLPNWLAQPGAPGWWPSLTYSWQEVHQYAINTPVTSDSGFTGSHRPDQLNTSQQVNASWYRERWGFSYGFNYSDQDNRQTGREQADFKNYGHQVSANLRATDRLNLNAGVSRYKNYSKEEDISRYTTSGNLGIDWQVSNRWYLSGNISRTLSDDSEDQADNENDDLQLQIARQFDIRAGNRRLPGQAFVRYSRTANESSNNIFDFSSRANYWNVDAGISLALF